MKHIWLFIFMIFYSLSCERTETGNRDVGDCTEDYFYYSNNQKVFIGLELIKKTKYNTYQLKVNIVKTGFESGVLFLILFYNE